MNEPVARQVDDLFGRSHAVLAGGVSASMRLHPYLGRPFYARRAAGAYLYDLNDQPYLDFNMSNGAALLGHGHPAVEARLLEGLRAGILTGSETPFHEELAARLVEIIPCAERVRFASTGTEVTTLAVRLARHVTGRARLLKFDGHFHGLSETFLYRRADPTDPASPVVPASGGLPPSGAQEIVLVPWNDPAAFDAALEQHAGQLAAVILEPVWYNAGCLLPASGFLAHLRRRTRQHGIVLIFDEVLSGFRMALGGAQAWSGVTPDLCTLAKALANGLPLSALCGRADVMEELAPGGPVAHSGTYSGQLLSVLAALAALDELSRPEVYPRLNATAERFYHGMQESFDRHGLPARAQGLGARFGLYFGAREPVSDYAAASRHDHALHRRFMLGCIERGVYFHAYTSQGAPGHAGFSLAHSDADLAHALDVIDAVASTLVRQN